MQSHPRPNPDPTRPDPARPGPARPGAAHSSAMNDRFREQGNWTLCPRVRGRVEKLASTVRAVRAVPTSARSCARDAVWIPAFAGMTKSGLKWSLPPSSTTPTPSRHSRPLFRHSREACLRENGQRESTPHSPKTNTGARADTPSRHAQRPQPSPERNGARPNAQPKPDGAKTPAQPPGVTFHSSATPPTLPRTAERASVDPSRFSDRKPRQSRRHTARIRPGHPLIRYGPPPSRRVDSRGFHVTARRALHRPA